MSYETLTIPFEMPPLLVQALAEQRRSVRPLRIGLLRDATTRRTIGEAPALPGLEFVTHDIDTDGHYANFDVSARSTEIAADLERCVAAFIDGNALDMLVEATSRTLTGAIVCQLALDRGLHLVTLNPRTDLALGHYLRQKAREIGRSYVFWQPTVVRAALALRATLTGLGMKIVSLGATVPPSQDEEMLSASALSSIMIDMACLANATGISLDRPGMNGKRCALNDIAAHYRPLDAGGILAVDACIDYVVLEEGEAGVYAVVEEAGDPEGGPIERRFRTVFSPVPDGDHGLLLGVAQALLGDCATGDAIYRPVADVCAVALRDVKPGERLSSTGENDYRGLAMRIDEIKWRDSIPIGLLEGAMAKQVIETDEPIGLENCVVDHTSTLFKLRGVQDGMQARH